MVTNLMTISRLHMWKLSVAGKKMQVEHRKLNIGSGQDEQDSGSRTDEKGATVVARERGKGYEWLVATIGEQLRQAREAQKMEIHEVADMTNIRGEHIRALEAGNYSVFSAPVYIRGFVRTYANHLHLDAKKILEELGRELADSGQIDPSLAPQRRSVVDRAMFQLAQGGRRLLLPASVAIVALVVVVAAYFLLRHFHSNDPTASLGEDFYQLPSNSGDTLPLPAVH
jgi:hypothetical protein